MVFVTKAGSTGGVGKRRYPIKEATSAEKDKAMLQKHLGKSLITK
jgi:hypothetical protein